MPRNASGVCSIPNVFTPNTVISSSQVNANFTDTASMLTDSLSRSGKGGMTAALDMGAFRIINIADPASAQDAVTRAFGETTYARLAAANNFTGSPLQYGGFEVGYRSLIQRTFGGNSSESASDNGRAVEYTGPGGNSFTLNGQIETAGGLIIIYNNGSGNLTITTTGTISWFNGSGTIPSGSRTLAVGGVATAWRQGANYRVSGTGLS